MTYAYDQTYLEKARTSLARMLDYAVYELHYDPSAFMELFITSGISSLFEHGDVHTIVGQSGVELAWAVLEKSGITIEHRKPVYAMDRSDAYWAGWALAYYQWNTAYSFERILRSVPMPEILLMYGIYHEMDIHQFVDQMNERMSGAKAEPNLKQLRRIAGMTQNELADASGIPIRTIQQYEQRQKNINKAQVDYLVALARALCCNIEDLLEPV